MIRPDGALVQLSDLEVIPFGPVVRVTNEKAKVIIEGSHGALVLQWAGDHTVRISGMSAAGPDMDQLPAYAAILPESGLENSLLTRETENEISIHSEQLIVHVDKQTMSFYLTDTAGNVLIHRHQYYSGENHLQCRGEITEGAQIYGLGETTGYLNKRGERYTMWNSDVYAPHVADMESLYQSIPVLLHHHEGKAFSMFVDNPGKMTFDMRVSHNTYRVDLETGILDCYFTAGPLLRDVVSRYTALTGRMNLPPLWAAGYQQSRYSYMNQEEVLELARTFRAKQIPCDVIYLDIHYMDEFRVFTFDPERFPDPKGMIAELRSLGIRIVPIVDPGVKIDEQFNVYRDGDQNRYFCMTKEGMTFQGEVWPGMSVFPDFSDAESSRWWGDLHRYYTDLGISGIWNDMNEPSVFACESKTMDLDVVHQNNGLPITHGEWHNMYGLSMSKATYEGLERALDGERPFVLTRAGYAGIQRYAAVWTGDNRSYWEHLAMFMPMSMNLGMSGIAFCGSDIGGFEHSTTGELLVRWTQMGVFSPLCRNHSAYKTLYQEPWRFGPEVEDICRQYIRLRYRLLPYLYTAFYEASQTGLPIMRPLAMEFPEDPQGYAISDQFMFGGNMLVAPIYRPETEHRVVYFPPGEWIDFVTGGRYTGGKHCMVHAPLDTMPIYVKAGSVIPETDAAEHTSDAGWQKLIVNFYSGSSEVGGITSEFKLYEDDGATTRDRMGQYNILKFSMSEDQTTLRLGYQYQHFAYDNRRMTLALVVKNLQWSPKAVEGLKQVSSIEELGSLEAGWAFDALHNECHIRIPQQKKWECLIIK
ncbi:DUF5110 domain-containing protein [Paenibacillus donghaensis]|nr:DUF5110 domain-containing protein [Paenibacillus donghaensis]